MTETRWYLRRGEPGSIEVVVEEREEPRRGVIVVWWLAQDFNRETRRVALRFARDELARRIANATRTPTTYDPQEIDDVQAPTPDAD